MPEHSLAAMRLAVITNKASNTALSEYTATAKTPREGNVEWAENSNQAQIDAIARALDDAGVRVFIEAVEVVVNATWPPSEGDVVKLEQALTALNGTKEGSDD